jgi:GNAT superfamily N-acetyltransferase
MPFVDRVVARRLETAQAWRSVKYAQAIQVLRPHAVSATEPVAGGYAIFTGPAFPVNRATGLGMHGPVTHADLEVLQRFYRSRGTVPRVDLCPLADPSLPELLSEAGYQLERFYSVLLRPLGEDAGPLPTTPGLRVDVARPEERDLWLHTVAQGFSGEQVPPQETLALLAPNFHSATAIAFLAWLDDWPAGGGAMVTHDGVAELCSASTRSAFRRRGVQTALLQVRLAAAREAGCDLAMVLTSPGSASQRNVERAGFGLAYTKAVMIGAE